MCFTSNDPVGWGHAQGKAMTRGQTSPAMAALLVWGLLAHVSLPKVLLNPAPTVEAPAPLLSTATARPSHAATVTLIAPGPIRGSSTSARRFSWGILRLGCDLRFG